MITSIKEIQKILKANKYKETKILTANRISVLVESNKRIETLNHIAKIFKRSGAIYNPNPYDGSSIGSVRFKNFQIFAKPISMQGTNRPGVQNEIAIIRRIKNFIKKNKKINIRFKSNKKNVVFRNITAAKHTGRIISERQKADLVLVNNKGKIFPISLKKDNATIFESADSYCTQKIKNHLIQLKKQKKIKLFKRKGMMQLYPKIAIKANRKESRDVVFGSDTILVVVKTFSPKEMVSKNKNLEINCSHLIQNLTDLGKKHKVWFHVRKDVTRNMPSFFPGLRIFAIMEKGICSTFLKIS